MDTNLLLHDVVDIRRQLHMYPEMGLKEHKTSKFIADFLGKLNIEVITGFAGTGVIGVVRGREGKDSIMVRADMDCLEVHEQTNTCYCSKTPGLMHACGHDGHMAAVLGLAKYIALSKLKFDSDILFVFQPAEEGPGGAKIIVDSGVLYGFNIKAVLGMHIFPEIKQGMVGCCSGPICARNGEIDIEIQGKSGHGALPHTGVDSVIIQSIVLQSIQTIITRRIDPRENAVITFGRIYGGEARNIIAGKVVMEGTIRAFSGEVYDIIKQSINNICSGIAMAYNCKIRVDIRDMYPEVYNDKQLFDILLEAAGKENVDIIKPLMIAEDFSFYKDVAPELLFLLGSRNEEAGFIYPLHSSKFDFDESILIKGIEVFKNMIEIIDRKPII